MRSLTQSNSPCPCGSGLLAAECHHDSGERNARWREPDLGREPIPSSPLRLVLDHVDEVLGAGTLEHWTRTLEVDPRVGDQLVHRYIEAALAKARSLVADLKAQGATEDAAGMEGIVFLAERGVLKDFVSHFESC